MSRVLKLSSVAALLLAACGSSDTGGGGGSPSAAADANVAYAQAQIAKYKQQPVFQAPGPAFDAKQLAGKTFVSIPVASIFPFTANLEATITDAAKKIGINWTEWKNQGNPTQWIQGVSSAMQQKATMIDLLAMSPVLLQSQIEQARAAGTKVVLSHSNGLEQALPFPLDGAVPVRYKEAGQLLADWVVANSGGNADVLVITADDIYSTGSLVPGLKDEFAARCAKCQFSYSNVPAIDWAQKVSTTVSGALARDPNINYIIPIYDGMASFAVAGVQVAGKAGKVHIATFNGDPNAIQLVQQGKVDMDLGEPLAWAGRAILDSEMRIALGLAPVQDQKIPLYVFDKSNAGDAGNPPVFTAGYGNGYNNGYEKLWGVG
ncbi:MAG TPA: sugar ABC transporter substrate-binding protein [Candidatus Dormibacteraeota bacterium]|nr:sugar ABC transporter substrate-binding protein [Candidatus Dormibacteraeota bacterium]